MRVCVCKPVLRRVRSAGFTCACPPDVAVAAASSLQLTLPIRPTGYGLQLQERVAARRDTGFSFFLFAQAGEGQKSTGEFAVRVESLPHSSIRRVPSTAAPSLHTPSPAPVNEDLKAPTLIAMQSLGLVTSSTAVILLAMALLVSRSVAKLSIPRENDTARAAFVNRTAHRIKNEPREIILGGVVYPDIDGPSRNQSTGNFSLYAQMVEY